LRVVKIRLKVLGCHEEKELLLPDIEARAEELEIDRADLFVEKGDEVGFERAGDKARRRRRPLGDNSPSQS